MKLRYRTVWLLVVVLMSTPLFAKTWYIRADGGTRYTSNVPSGQCDGQADVAYPGSGKNRHCAFKDFRYLWDDDSGVTYTAKWVIAGGDTVIVRGCSAGPNQTDPANPDCRVGWDKPFGGPQNNWCYYIRGGSYACYNPPIPAGTPTQHTRILGQHYANCNASEGTNPRDYASNLTQIFGGFSVLSAFSLEDTQYVDVQCIELTTHNGVCTGSGMPSYPRGCNRSPPLDDYGQNGFRLNSKSGNITFQDVYVHGFNSSGFTGPIGGPILMTRVFSGFNGFAGWNFDDGNDTPDGPGSSISAHYVTMIANGCYEEYPIVHSFSARACYDDVSNGFGDAWSGQDTPLDSFICDHCVMAYNTKDAFIGPHTQIKTLIITNSKSYANMGAQWKWLTATGGTVKFFNNLTIGNCARYSDAAHPIPGASHSFASSSKLPGANLSDYCRAAGNAVAINSQQNSQVLFANNTFVDASATVFDLGCGPTVTSNSQCATAHFIFTNNIFLGYTFGNEDAPGLFYFGDSSIKVTSTHNIEYGNRHQDMCIFRGIICSDPALANEPPQKRWTQQDFLDNFTFYPTAASPAIRRGMPVNEVTADFYGTQRPRPPSIGAVEPHAAK